MLCLIAPSWKCFYILTLESHLILQLSRSTSPFVSRFSSTLSWFSSPCCSVFGAQTKVIPTIWKSKKDLLVKKQDIFHVKPNAKFVRGSILTIYLLKYYYEQGFFSALFRQGQTSTCPKIWVRRFSEGVRSILAWVRPILSWVRASFSPS